MLSPGARAYIADTCRLWLGVAKRHADRIRPLPDALAHQLLRTEEVEASHLDFLGRWEHTFNDNYQRGALWEPELDRWLHAERARLGDDAELLPPWPDGHPFAVCITHDVDAISSQRTLADRVRKLRMTAADRDLPSLPRKDQLLRALAVTSALARKHAPIHDTADTLGECIAIEQAHGVKASYFFTVFPNHQPSRFDCTYALDDPCIFRGERVTVAHILQYLRREGFDVGLHPSFLSSTRQDMLARQKSRLEHALGAPVTTLRQHYLAYTHSRTPSLQHRAGFLADTTLGFNRNMGFRAGTSLPHYHFDHARDRALGLIQAPLIVHDGPIFRQEGLDYTIAQAKANIGRVFDRIRDTQGCATVLIHPETLTDDRYRQLLLWCIDYGKRHNAWFATLHQLQAWWRSRAEALEIDF